MNIRYKSLPIVKGRIYSWGCWDDEWKIWEWKKVDGEIKCCRWGFHCCTSPEIVRTFTIHGTIFKVEVRGKSHIAKRQEAWSEMRVIESCDIPQANAA